MSTAFTGIAVLSMWAVTFFSTYWVWTEFGGIVGFLFLMFVGSTLGSLAGLPFAWLSVKAEDVRR